LAGQLFLSCRTQEDLPVFEEGGAIFAEKCKTLFEWHVALFLFGSVYHGEFYGVL
jgi:hypothetical protein